MNTLDKIDKIFTVVLTVASVIGLAIMLLTMINAPHYECIEYNEPETTCVDKQVCKAPGKGGQCWFYETQQECKTKATCKVTACVENCD